ncbi:MAG: amidohydrolase family protein [Alphaproteobacteria bacterium]|nr:amidohydrolase family protein [Alphaproteobacteria bacterium]
MPIDMHSHWGTRRGYPLRTEEELAQQRTTWNSDPCYATEQEMADHFRQHDMRVILDFGFDKTLPIPEAAELHDYGFAVQREHADVILGNWLHIAPQTGAEGVRELRRCRDATTGFLGFAVSGSSSGPPSDNSWAPFYKLCIDAGIPALIFVGTTGLGAGMPGGGGILLDDCHPRHLDWVAAHYPELTIVAARPGWPWQPETNAVLLHKRNIWYELHGWSPKYFAPELKYEISRRLRDRVMFGADYPLFTYQRLEREWRAEGYSDEVLQGVFTRNAERFLASLRG